MPKFSYEMSDKIGHFAAYGTLVFVSLNEAARVHRWLTRTGRWLIGWMVFALAYGLLLEVLQGLLFYERTFDFADMLANTIGALIGLLLFQIAFKSLKKVLEKTK